MAPELRHDAVGRKQVGQQVIGHRDVWRLWRGGTCMLGYLIGYSVAPFASDFGLIPVAQLSQGVAAVFELLL